MRCICDILFKSQVVFRLFAHPANDLRLVTQDQDNGVTSEKHFTDKSVLVDRLLVLPFRYLGPHLFHILEYHVAVPIKGFDPCKELLVVSE